MPLTEVHKVNKKLLREMAAKEPSAGKPAVRAGKKKTTKKKEKTRA
jgi:hypothetical protein